MSDLRAREAAILADNGSPAREPFVWARDVRTEAVSWLWSQRIPRGALTVLAGDPGQGKSVLTCELAARVSRGQALPPGEAGEPEAVLMLTAEDALGAVVRPRLAEAGADLARVALWAGDGAEPLTLPSGLGALAAWVGHHRPALVVVDPVVAFLDGGLNAHRDQDVRRALRPLAELAEASGAAIVVVMHLNKAQGGQPMYRLGGSIGFAGAARSVLLFARPPDAEDTDPTRIVAVAKSSYAAIAPAVELRLAVEPAAEHPSVGWRGELAGVGAADLLRGGDDAEARSATDDAAEWLEGEMAGGERAASELQSGARAAGISTKALKSAKRRLGVESERRGGVGASGAWFWRLPDDAQQAFPLSGPSAKGSPSEDSEGPLSENPHGNGNLASESLPFAPMWSLFRERDPLAPDDAPDVEILAEGEGVVISIERGSRNGHGGPA